MPGPLVNAGYESLPNPYRLEALGGVLKPSGALCGILLLVGVLASAASLVVRFRSSRGEERSQLKWLVYAGVVVVFAAAVSLATEGLAPDSDAAIVQAMQLTLVASLSTVPIAAGIAILRYRLYDIDVLINRTLVYGSLTALLAAVYVGCVVLIQAVLRTLTGHESTLAVVASTLAVAALFSPLRRRVQGFIDRRFYRRKYDAAKTLEAFTAKLREEPDLGRRERRAYGGGEGYDAASPRLFVVAPRYGLEEGRSAWLIGRSLSTMIARAWQVGSHDR